MYKTHITQWGLDKKNKEPEMRTIVRKHKQRELEGKTSTIHVRGQIRTIEEAFRYWERKGVSVDDIIARQTASPTPEAVKLFTPVPSPILTPQVFAIPGRMFHLVQDYFKGCFETGMWYSEDPTHECCSIKDENSASRDWGNLFSECDLASTLYVKDSSYEAKETLSKAITRIKQILLAEHPANLTELFRLIMNLRRRERAEMALVILRQFSVMGKAVLGTEHPFSRICEWFEKVYESDFADIVIGCCEIVVDQLKSSVGSLHLSTLYSHIELIGIRTRTGNAGIQDTLKYLEECEKTLETKDPRSYDVRGWTANDCFNAGRYDDAMSLIQKNIAYSQNQSGMEFASSIYSLDLALLAMCQHALGEIDRGIATLHEAIDVRISEWGTQDARARYWLLYLEYWYSEQGLWESADVARELRLVTLEPRDAVD